MAIGGFNGTDPAPTLKEFKAYVGTIRSTTSFAARMMFGQWGSHEQRQPRSRGHRRVGGDHYTPLAFDRAIVYDLTQPPKNT